MAHLPQLSTISSQTIRQVGVIGAGQMGSGIAQVLAQAGYGVQLLDVTEDRLTSKGKIAEADKW